MPGTYKTDQSKTDIIHISCSPPRCIKMGNCRYSGLTELGHTFSAGRYPMIKV